MLNFRQEFMMLESTTKIVLFKFNKKRTPRSVDPYYAMAYCFTENLIVSVKIATIIKKKFGGVQSMQRQQTKIRKVLSLTRPLRSVFYLVMEELSSSKLTYQATWDRLHE